MLHHTEYMAHCEVIALSALAIVTSKYPFFSRVTLTRAVDTEPASSSYATGFIVDKTRGIILTNRHVVTPGLYARRWTLLACQMCLQQIAVASRAHSG